VIVVSLVSSESMHRQENIKSLKINGVCISTCIVNAAVHILVIVIIHLDRMAYRRQKRWWNAYILFYERQDEKDEKDIYKTLQDLTIGWFSNL